MNAIRGSSKSLKSANFGWLCALVAFDLVAICIVVMPGVIETAAASKIAIARSVGSVLLPIIPLILVNVLPQIAKTRLVFWRWNHPNPGSRAFSRYIYRDDRINVDQLRKNVGVFPVVPKEQNALWFGLYKKCENEVSVLDAHRHFLLFRDMAALSLMLLTITVTFLPLMGFSAIHTGQAVMAFAFQYLLTALAARTAGERFVCTVMALHSLKKTRAPAKI